MQLERKFLVNLINYSNEFIQNFDWVGLLE